MFSKLTQPFRGTVPKHPRCRGPKIHPEMVVSSTRNGGTSFPRHCRRRFLLLRSRRENNIIIYIYISLVPTRINCANVRLMASLKPILRHAMDPHPRRMRKLALKICFKKKNDLWNRMKSDDFFKRCIFALRYYTYMKTSMSICAVFFSMCMNLNIMEAMFMSKHTIICICI